MSNHGSLHAHSGSSCVPTFPQTQSSQPVLAVSHPPLVHPEAFVVQGLTDLTQNACDVQFALGNGSSAIATEPSPIVERANSNSPPNEQKPERKLLTFIYSFSWWQNCRSQNIEDNAPLIRMINEANDALVKMSRIARANVDR